MECPFHAGNEAITTCVQCETPICPLCASESNQIHLCLNCYRARVEELSGGLGSASTRLAKERQKAETKVSRKHKKAAAEVKPVPEAKPSFELGSESSLWEKDEQSPPLAAQMEPAPDIYPVPAPPKREEPVEGLQPFLSPEASFGAPSGAPQEPFEPPPSKKELARLKKEEAKRIKAEEKEAKKSKKDKPASEPEAVEMQEAPIDFEFEEPPPSKKELARLKKEEAKRIKAEEKEAKKSKKDKPASEPEAVEMQEAPIDFEFEEPPPSKKELARLKKEEAKRIKAEEKEAKKQAPLPEFDVLPMPMPLAESGLEAPEIPFQEPFSKKELARLKKEEAKRIKAEEKEAKKQAPLPEPIAMPQQPAAELPFIEAPEPMPQAVEPQTAMPDFITPPPAADEMPSGFKPESPAEGLKLPRLEERLEPMPKDQPDDRGRTGTPEAPSGPPEGFFD